MNYAPYPGHPFGPRSNDYPDFRPRMWLGHAGIKEHREWHWMALLPSGVVRLGPVSEGSPEKACSLYRDYLEWYRLTNAFRKESRSGK